MTGEGSRVALQTRDSPGGPPGAPGGMQAAAEGRWGWPGTRRVRTAAALLAFARGAHPGGAPPTELELIMGPAP